MRSKCFLQKVLVLIALAATLFALTACQNEEQLDEAVETLEASAEPTEAPPPTQEPTQAPAAETATEPASQPEAAEVQETESTEMTEFANDLFSVAHPAGWIAEEHEDSSGLTLASSDSGLARFKQGDGPDPGEFAINISLTPAELFGTLFIQVEPGSSAEALAGVFMSVLDNTPDTEEATTRIVALEDGRELALVPAANDGAEGALVFFEVSDGIVALITISAHPGEFEALEEEALAVISSLNFSGTAEELLEAIDPVPPADFVFG